MLAFPPSQVLVASPAGRPSAAARRYAEALVKPFGSRIAAVTVAAGTDGDGVSRALDAARDSAAQLIVCPSELAPALVRFCGVPVLSVRAGAPAPKAVLAAANLHACALTALDYAVAVGRALGLKVTVLHVRENARRAAGPLQRLTRAARAAAKNGDVELKIVRGRPVPSILAAAPRQGLIVIVPHRKGAFHDGVLGENSLRLLTRSRTPVLTVPAGIALDGGV